MFLQQGLFNKHFGSCMCEVREASSYDGEDVPRVLRCPASLKADLREKQQQEDWFRNFLTEVSHQLTTN